MGDHAARWDDRYSEHDDQMWSGNANGALVAEIADLPPGRALDVGCGEGADAIWLASRGWTVTAVDVSQVAIDRAAAAGRDAGVTVDWRQEDLTTGPDLGSFDLVSVFYPALPHEPDDRALDAVLGAVAPGGTLLFVGHADMDPDHAREHGFPLEDHVQADDVVARLGDGWTVDAHARRPRPGGHSTPGSRHSHDVVLRARYCR